MNDEKRTAAFLAPATQWRLPLAALLCCLTLAFWSARNRIPWSDEGWFSSPAYNLAYHGYLGTTVVEPTSPGFTRIDRRTYWVMPLFLLGQGYWFKVFPHGVIGARAFSIFWAPVAALSFGIFLSRLFPGSRLPAWASSLLLTSYIFIDNAAFARPDMMCLALGLCGLASFVVLRERSLPLAIFAGNCFVAASGMSHPNGIFHFLALCVCIVWFDWKRLNLLCLGAAVAPYLVGATMWGLYILEDKQAFLDQFGVNGANGGNGRLPGSWNPIGLVVAEFRERYWFAFGLATGGFALVKLISAFAYFGSLILCLSIRKLRTQPGVRLLATLFFVYFGAMCVFNQKLTYYLLHILPIYIALLSAVILYFWDRLPRGRVWIALAVAVFAIVETSGIVIRGLTRSYIGPQRAAVAYIDAVSKPGDLIYGSASLLYEMNFDKRLVDDPWLGTTSGRRPDVIVLEDLYKPNYEGWSRTRPEAMAAVRKRLAEYRLTKSIAEYDIYTRPERIANPVSGQPRADAPSR